MFEIFNQERILNNIIINTTIFKEEIPLSISVCNNLSEIDLDIIINGAKSAMEKCIISQDDKKNIINASCTARYYSSGLRTLQGSIIPGVTSLTGAIKDIKLHFLDGKIKDLYAVELNLPVN
jgi:hypothetical protein